jgi:hypothetical protein
LLPEVREWVSRRYTSRDYLLSSLINWFQRRRLITVAHQIR